MYMYVMVVFSWIYCFNYPACCPCRSTSSQLLLWPLFRASPQSRNHSPALQRLLFTSHSQTVYTHTTHRYMYMEMYIHTYMYTYTVYMYIVAHSYIR